MASEESPADGADTAEDGGAAGGGIPSIASFEEDIQQVNISEEMEEAYLNYSMSVLVGRALPDARDGFKPVHRRVLYAMWRLGNRHDVPYKKSARVVGDVIGKYHPHGDASVYDAIVRMAQPFSLRYTLVDGHGNFGTVDRDPAAAMRYTEVRLSRIAEEMLTDIDRGTVDMTANFDGTELEPSVLPARFPQLLVNGCQGIAVGMTSNIPTHNLSDTIDACLYGLSHPECGVDDLASIIKAPDFPTGGIVFGLSEVRKAYRTGRGSMLVRAKVRTETDSKGRSSLIVDELPYMVNKAELIKKIATLRNEGKIQGISDIRDESSKRIRVVIDLKKDAHPEAVENNLYKMTDLQTSFPIVLVALLDGRPQQLNLKQLVDAFLGLRREVVIRRTRFLLNKARADCHLQEGLAIALANIDEFIAIIKSSANRAEAAERLMGRGWKADLALAMVEAAEGEYADYRPGDVEPPEAGFGTDGLYRLSAVQAERILDMRLQTLTATQQESINASYRELCAQIRDYLDILRRDERVVKIITDDLLYIKERYGDSRRSSIDASGDPDFDELDLVPQEDVVITLSRDGYIKRQRLSDYRPQGRGGTGRRSGKLKDEDSGNLIAVAGTHDHVLFFTDLGRAHLVDHAFRLPEGSGSSKGRAIQNFIKLEEREENGEKALESVTSMLALPTPPGDKCIFFSTARSPVRSALYRLNRNQVALREIPLADRAAARKAVEAALAGMDSMDEAAWDDLDLSGFPGPAVATARTLAGRSGDTGKTWSSYRVADLLPEDKAVAAKAYREGLASLAALGVADFDSLPVGDLPQGARDGAREAFRTTLLSDYARTHYVLFATRGAFVKRLALTELSRIQKAGLPVISLQPGDSLAGTALTGGNRNVMLFSSEGKAARFSEGDVRPSGRTSRGVRGMKLPEDAHLVSMVTARDGEGGKVLVATSNGIGKRTDIEEYAVRSRHTQGIISIPINERLGRVVAACMVEDGDEVMLLTKKGQLVRTPAAGIRECGRSAQGVKLINIGEDDELVSVTTVKAVLKKEEDNG